MDQIDQTDHDLDHVHLSLLFLYVVQDLNGTDPTQEICQDHADYTAPTWQHELDHTDQQYICPTKSSRS